MILMRSDCDRASISNVVFWGVALALVQKIGAIIVTLVLVRLISAEAFGQFGLMNAILMFAFTFSMQRFMEHTFHDAAGGESGYANHLGFGILLHLSIFVALNAILALSPLPANYAAVRVFAHVASLSILLNVPRIFYSVHLRRILDWRRQRLIHLMSFALSAVGSIGIALAGYGVWALIAQNLLVPLPYIVDLIVKRPDLVHARFELSKYGETLRFGGVRSLAGMVGVGQQLAEASLFTAVAGFASFGIYGRAVGIATLASAWLSDQMHGLMYPIIARAKPDSAQSRRAAGLVLRLAMWTSVPLAASFFFLSETIVRVLYGSAWIDVAPLVKPALVVAVLGTTMRGLSLILLVTQGPMFSLAGDLAQLVLRIVALIFVLRGGILGYLWFLAAGSAAVLMLMVVFLARCRVLSFADVTAAVVPMLIVTTVVGLVSTSGELAILDAQHSPLVLVASILVSIAIETAIVRLIDPLGLATACQYLPYGSKIAALLRLPLLTRQSNGPSNAACI